MGSRGTEHDFVFTDDETDVLTVEVRDKGSSIGKVFGGILDHKNPPRQGVRSLCRIDKYQNAGIHVGRDRGDGGGLAIRSRQETEGSSLGITDDWRGW